jgi:hypothetical protein
VPTYVISETSFRGPGFGRAGVKSAESNLTLDAVVEKTKKLGSEVRSCVCDVLCVHAFLR